MELENINIKINRHNSRNFGYNIIYPNKNLGQGGFETEKEAMIACINSIKDIFNVK